MGGVTVRADRQSNLPDLFNRLVDRDAGLSVEKATQIRWTRFDGSIPSVNGSAAKTSQRTLVLRQSGGLHLGVLLSATAHDADPSSANSVLLVDDAALAIGAGRALRLYNAAGSFYHQLVSTATATRTLTLQDLAGTVALLGVANAGGNLLFVDNTYDIGASGATRPRDLFLGRNAVIGGTLTVGATTLGGNLIFSPDATYDIGASGATRARDLFLSRDATVGRNLLLPGTAARVTGDFSNATRANRLFFQDSAANADTNVSAMPSGANTIGKFEAYNNATPASATGIASLQANATEVRLTADFASGTGLPLQVWAGGAKVLEATPSTGAITLPLQPRARVYNSALISHTTSGTWQTLTFDSERYDVGALHSTSVNTSRLTAPSAGSYRMGGCISFGSNATGFRGVRVLLNGATILTEIFMAAGAVGGNVLAVATEYDLALNDYVELQGWQDSGGALNMTLAGNAAPEFWISRYA